jgi:hypothetical protein
MLKEQVRYLLVVLLSEEHDDTLAFCQMCCLTRRLGSVFKRTSALSGVGTLLNRKNVAVLPSDFLIRALVGIKDAGSYGK